MLPPLSGEALYAFARQVVPCVGFNTRRATRLITQYYDQALAPAGLRSTQYSLLSLLALTGAAPMQQVAALLAMDRTTLSRNLAPLLRKRWLTVTVGEDRRARIVRLTAKGQAMLRQAQPYWQAAQDHLVTSLGTARWDTLLTGLHQLSLIVDTYKDTLHAEPD